VEESGDSGGYDEQLEVAVRVLGDDRAGKTATGGLRGKARVHYKRLPCKALWAAEKT